MARSSARRSHAVQVDKTVPPARPSDGNANETRLIAPTAVVPWYWRLVLFLWCTSFGFLLLYEWLGGLIKAWYAAPKP